MKPHQQIRLQKNRFLNGKNRNFRPRIYPIFLSPLGYYFLTVSVALVVFFIFWGLLQDTGEKTPWIPAGFFSSLLLLVAVIVREVFLRKTLVNSKANSFAYFTSKPVRVKKSAIEFSFRQNARMLKLIESRSKTAREKENLSLPHMEVFELCEDYLKLSKQQLNHAELGSTRWGAIKNGRNRVKKVHKHHLISWAAIESKRLTKEAGVQSSISRKVDTAKKAGQVLESALGFYPEDKQLIESIQAISDFVSSIKITHWIELAEKSAFKGNYKRAISHYKDALFYLARENVQSVDKDQVAEKINIEIKKLRKLYSKEIS